jgi:hypothetical protein
MQVDEVNRPDATLTPAIPSPHQTIGRIALRRAVVYLEPTFGSLKRKPKATRTADNHERAASWLFSRPSAMREWRRILAAENLGKAVGRCVMQSPDGFFMHVGPM